MLREASRYFCFEFKFAEERRVRDDEFCKFKMPCSVFSTILQAPGVIFDQEEKNISQLQNNLFIFYMKLQPVIPSSN